MGRSSWRWLASTRVCLGRHHTCAFGLEQAFGQVQTHKVLLRGDVLCIRSEMIGWKWLRVRRRGDVIPNSPPLFRSVIRLVNTCVYSPLSWLADEFSGYSVSSSFGFK